MVDLFGLTPEQIGAISQRDIQTADFARMISSAILQNRMGKREQALRGLSIGETIRRNLSDEALRSRGLDLTAEELTERKRATKVSENLATRRLDESVRQALVNEGFEGEKLDMMAERLTENLVQGVFGRRMARQRFGLDEKRLEEDIRGRKATESIGERTLLETIRRNKAAEGLSGEKLTLESAKYAEAVRRNLVLEDLNERELKEVISHNRNLEILRSRTLTETERRNRAVENLRGRELDVDAFKAQVKAENEGKIEGADLSRVDKAMDVITNNPDDPGVTGAMDIVNEFTVGDYMFYWDDTIDTTWIDEEIGVTRVKLTDLHEDLTAKAVRLGAKQRGISPARLIKMMIDELNKKTGE